MLKPSLAMLTLLGLACAGAATAPPGMAASPRSEVDARLTLPAPTTSHHYIANVGSATRAVKRIGFTVIDTGSSREEIRALPKGTQALVWLGEECPSHIDPAFRRQVHRLAKSPRVFGYYLSDEPNDVACPDGPTALATRARYIRRQSHHAQQSFIVLSGGYHRYRPQVTGVSMTGIDPYPCSTAHPTCAFGKIKEKVSAARRAGIPRDEIVPVYEAFGQENTASHYYNQPTADQMRTMLEKWAALVPHPPMDYAYGWGHQDSANPTLRDSQPLKDLFGTYFAG